MKQLFVFLSFTILFTSCYRMAGEDDFSTIPATNNPRITCEKQGGSSLPGMNY